MKASVETNKPVPTSIRKFRTKDGRDVVAEKVAKANEVLDKYPLPDFITKR